MGQAPELKYFLIQFVTKHYGRIRATVKQQYAESFYFLDAALADATMASDQQDQAIEQFLAGAGDEIEIQVRNVTLESLETPPYTASVDFDRVYYGAGHRQERRRETAVARITFVLRDQIPNAVIPVNPAGARHHVRPRRPGVPMIANSAFLAAMVLLVGGFLLLDQLDVPEPLQARPARTTTSGSIVGVARPSCS